MTKIEQMGLDLYNALRRPLSRMETTEEMDNFKIELGNDKRVISECMKCAQINIESGKSMMAAGVHMNWEAIDHYNNLIIEACNNAINKEENKMAFTLNGVTYSTNEKGNYFYKTTGAKDKKGNDLTMRIGKAVYEKAFEEYMDTMEANTDDLSAEEIEEKAEVEEKKEVKKPKEKKARRSKDIAYEYTIAGGTFLTLTEKQVDFLHHLKDTCFWENGLESAPWCDVLADEIGGQFASKPMTVGAMISTLREKGLITVAREDGRKGKPKFMTLTELGKKVVMEVAPELA